VGYQLIIFVHCAIQFGETVLLLLLLCQALKPIDRGRKYSEKEGNRNADQGMGKSRIGFLSRPSATSFSPIRSKVARVGTPDLTSHSISP